MNFFKLIYKKDFFILSDSWNLGFFSFNGFKFYIIGKELWIILRDLRDIYDLILKIVVVNLVLKIVVMFLYYLNLV